METTTIFYVLIVAFGAFLATYLTMPSLIRILIKSSLVDTPNHRASHNQPVPTMGGIGIFAGMLAVMGFWFTVGDILQNALIVLGMLSLTLTGVFDDRYDISPYFRLMIQASTGVLLSICGIRLEHLHGFLGIYELTTVWQYIITIGFVVFVINAFNLIDGINGLAGGLAFINSLAMAIVFFITGEKAFAMLATSVAATSLAFLFFNFGKAKVFMGDTGSLTIGFLLAAFSIKGIGMAEHMTLDGVGDPALVLFISLTVVFVPVYDAVRVMITRLMAKKSPMKADKTHIHHLLLKTGFDHTKASVSMYLVNGSLLALAVWFSHWHITSMVVLLLVGQTLVFELILLKIMIDRSSDVRKTEREAMTIED